MPPTAFGGWKRPSMIPWPWRRLKFKRWCKPCRHCAAWPRSRPLALWPNSACLSRFSNPRQLMGYSGLVSSEHSSGNRIQRGSITKTGNAHLRRVIVEAAWAYQHKPWIGGFLLRRQRDLKLTEETKEIAWKAQYRLHKRYNKLAARGKNKNQIVTAVGRELLG